MLTSPLTRTLETTLAAFGHLLNGRSVEDTSTDSGARLILEPDLQERSDLPCDTGSSRTELEKKFPDLDFGILEDEWYAKEGAYAADDTTVLARAERVRQRLFALAKELEGNTSKEKRNIVVVTHEVFMKFLAGDEAIDLPKAGWKAYNVINQDDGKAILQPAE